MNDVLFFVSITLTTIIGLIGIVFFVPEPNNVICFGFVVKKKREFVAIIRNKKTCVVTIISERQFTLLDPFNETVLGFLPYKETYERDRIFFFVGNRYVRLSACAFLRDSGIMKRIEDSPSDAKKITDEFRSISIYSLLWQIAKELETGKRDFDSIDKAVINHISDSFQKIGIEAKVRADCKVYDLVARRSSNHGSSDDTMQTMQTTNSNIDSIMSSTSFL